MYRLGHVLLTGATGFLGRYLLRDLLASHYRVVVLAHPTRCQTASDRVTGLLEWCEKSAGYRLPVPTVLAGDLNYCHLGLSPSDRSWIAANCRQVIHAAARTTLRTSPDGEPARSNVEGTQRLLDLCQRSGH